MFISISMFLWEETTKFRSNHFLADPLKSRTRDRHAEKKSAVAVISKKGHKSFDFLHLLWGMVEQEDRVTYYLISNNQYAHTMIFVDGAIAGAAAGVIVESALYPIDTIKTRLQAGWFYTNVVFLLISLECILLFLFYMLLSPLLSILDHSSNIHLILKCGKLRLISSVYTPFVGAHGFLSGS